MNNGHNDTKNKVHFEQLTINCTFQAKLKLTSFSFIFYFKMWRSFLNVFFFFFSLLSASFLPFFLSFPPVFIHNCCLFSSHTATTAQQVRVLYCTVKKRNFSTTTIARGQASRCHSLGEPSLPTLPFSSSYYIIAGLAGSIQCIVVSVLLWRMCSDSAVRVFITMARLFPVPMSLSLSLSPSLSV